MYLSGISVRRVNDITEALWGSKVALSIINELNKKAYVYEDGIHLPRNYSGKFKNVDI